MSFLSWIKELFSGTKRTEAPEINESLSPEDLALQAEAKKYGLEPTASWVEIGWAKVAVANEKSRREAALDAGLHEYASWAEIGLAGDREARSSLGQDLEISGCPTWAEIRAARAKEETRKQLAKERGLPETATWKEIGAAQTA